MRRALPWWLIVVVVIETLPMLLGPIVAFTFPPMMGGVGAEEINQAAFIYTARSLAGGVAFLIALALRSAPM